VERIVTKPKERKVKTRNGEVTVENKKDRKVPEDIKVKEKVSVGMDALKGIIAGLIDEKLKNMVVQGQGEIPIMQRSQPSVEIKFDGKDKVSWTVKAYADTVEQAFKEAEAVHDTMMEENGEDEDE